MSDPNAITTVNVSLYPVSTTNYSVGLSSEGNLFFIIDIFYGIPIVSTDRIIRLRVDNTTQSRAILFTLQTITDLRATSFQTHGPHSFRLHASIFSPRISRQDVQAYALLASIQSGHGEVYIDSIIHCTGSAPGPD